MLRHDDNGLAPFSQSLDHRNGDFRRDLPDPPKPKTTETAKAFAWTIRRLLMGWDVDLVHIEALSSRHAAIAEALREEPDLERRDFIFSGWTLAQNDPDEISRSLLAIDPESAFPDGEPPEEWANLGDVRSADSSLWIWPGWIPDSRLCAIAGPEGVGKSRACLDLHRRVWNGLVWPDGTPATIEPRRPAIWIAADGQQSELAEAAENFGLPLESIYFPTGKSEPFGGTNIDDPETVATGGALDRMSARLKPWAVFVDSATYATSAKLHDQIGVKLVKDRLAPLAQKHRVPIVLLMHVNKEGQTLGLRVRGIARVVVHLSKPDPESEKLRFWVEKSCAEKPAAIGVTMGTSGNEYDEFPPEAPSVGADRDQGSGPKRGRPPTSRERCAAWLETALAERPQKVVELLDKAETEGFSKKTFFRTKERLEEAGRLVEYEMPAGSQGKTLKHWRLVPPDDSNGRPDVAEPEADAFDAFEPAF